MSRQRLIGLSLVVSILLSPAAGAMTPTPGPTPQPTGDLGTKEVTGRVVDGLDGTAIAGAEVVYRNVQRFGPVETGSIVTDAAGEFSFSLTLHDTDSISIEVSAAGYDAPPICDSGYQLWIAPPLAIDMLPLRGTVEVAPNSGVSLGCEGDGEVTIRNSQPDGGEDLTIVAILPGNSYSQGDYGTGFSWDLSQIELPVTLAPGEEVAFPVHYSAAGQSYPSRLTIRMRSTAGESAGFAVPYRGAIGCGTPTPTATPGETSICPGDCDGGGTVTIDELVRSVAWALGNHDVGACANADLDASGTVLVNEIVAAVVAAAEGCPR